MCYVAGKSPLPTSPIRDQVVVSHSQKIIAPGPRPISTSIDQESGQSDAPDGAALHRGPRRELPANAVPPHLPSIEVPCRREPSPPGTMNIRHMLHDNAHDRGLLRSSVNTAVDHYSNLDISEESPVTDSHASDGQQCSPDGNSHEGHILSEIQDGAVRLLSVTKRWRDPRTEEETEPRERGEEDEGAEKGRERQVEGEEEDNDREENEQQPTEGEEDGDGDNDDNSGRDKEPTKEMNGAKSKKEANRSIRGKENEREMTGREMQSVSPADQSSSMKSRRESKRRANGEEPVDSISKRPKTRSLTPTKDIASLKGLEHIPKSSIQPAKVYQVFLDRSHSEDLDGMRLLTRLFFAIASPDAFYQLRDACISVRVAKVLTMSQSTNSIVQTIRALDNLDTAASTNSILRRYHLTQLVDHRDERETHHKSERPERAARRPSSNTEGYGRASSLG